MNWSVFLFLVSIIMMIGGLIWYNETIRHYHGRASALMVLGALLMAFVIGVNV